MRRALWFGAVLLTVAGANCQPSADETGGGGSPLTEAGLVPPDGGIADESGTGSSTPDKVSPTFAGIKSATALSETQIGVTWDAATDDRTAQGTIAYRIYVAETAGGQLFTTAAITAPAGATGATISGLHAYKQYFVVVRSVDGAGNEDTNTVEKSATTLDTQAPTFAGVKSVSGTASQDVLVAWEPATDNGSDPSLIHYELYASSTQGGENFATATVTTPAGATSATITGLPEAAPVFVVVRAIDAANNKDSNKHETFGVTLDKTAPTFAGVAAATSLGTTINLTWVDASDNVDLAPSIRYDVFSSKTSGGQNFATPDFTTQPGANAYAATNLPVSTKYYFVVRAHDSSENVDQNTVEKSATTAASPDIKAPVFAGLAAATATTDQSIDLSWQAATDDLSPANQIVYDVYSASASGGESYTAPLYTTAPGALNFTVPGLSPGQKVYYVVRARDAAGNQEKNAVEKSATTLPDTIPPTFAGLTSATTLSPTSIQLSWSAATDDISLAPTIRYRVYRATAAGTENFSVATLDVVAGQTSVTMNALAPNTPYYFVVRALDEANNLDTNTVEKTSKTLADTTAPTFAGAVTMTSLSATSVTVSWAVATDDVTPSAQIDYLAYLSTTPGGENFAVLPTPTAASATSTTFNGLTPNTTYYAVVRARDAAGNIDKNVVEKSVSSQADTTAPTFGGAISVGSATDQSLKVTWNAASDNATLVANITYLICMTQTAGGCNGGSFSATATVTGGVTNRTFTGLSPQVTYYFVVRAKDAYNNVDGNSNQVSGATLDDTVKPTFAGLATAVSGSATTIDLAWTAGSDDLSTPAQLVYDIYESTTTGGQNFTSATYTTAANATSYKVTNLLPKQKRYYVVRARDVAGNNDANVVEKSATVIDDTIAPTFGGVTSVTSTGLTSLKAAWNAATDNVSAQNAAIVYYVCWSTGTTCTTAFSAMATTAPGALNTTITSLLANTKYNVVVRAHDTNGNTDANVTVVAGTTDKDTTPPNSPAVPQITAAAATSLTLGWPLATDNYSVQSTLKYLICMTTTPTGCSGASFSTTLSLTNQSSHTFSSLANLQTYYFVVRAQDEAGNIDANDDVVSGQTSNDLTAPTFGALTSATALGDSRIQLNWTAGSDNVSTPAQLVYDIYQSTSAGAESYASPTYTSAAGAVQYVVSNLLPFTNYYFVVRARDAAGNRDANTTERTAKTLADTVPPTFVGVSGVSVVSDSQLQASWAPATDDTAASSAISYQVCWALNNGCTTSFVAMATTAANATSYTTAVRSLVPATGYTFVVRAVDAVGNVDANTATATNTTLADTVVPTFAGASSVTGVTYKNATVNWPVASDDYTTTANMRYAICVTTSNGGCNNAAFSAFATVTNQTSYSFTNLTPVTAYWFVVRAEDQANNFNVTNQNLQVTTTTLQETNAPTFAGLTSAVTTGPTTMTLTWPSATDDYSSATQIKYNIFRATSAGTENYALPYAANVVGVAGTNTYPATGLTPGTAYYWVVRAVDGAGNTETNTSEKSATTQATLPSFTSQPTSSAQSTTSMNISWAASSTPATTISYEYCITTTNTGCNNFGSGTSTGTTASASPGGLAANTTYYFVVKATNTTGSTYSNQGFATTDPTPPTMTGTLTCNHSSSIDIYPSYLNVTASNAATPGSLAVSGYEMCWSTSSFACGVANWSASYSPASRPNGLWIGSPSAWSPSTGNLTNGPGMSPSTLYYVRIRARDSANNLSNIVSTTCTTPVSGSQNLNPWFTANCSGCHAWTAAGIYASNTSGCASKPYVDRATYTTAGSYMWQKTNLTSPGCGVLMPQGAVTPIDTTILSKWITQGAGNN